MSLIQLLKFNTWETRLFKMLRFVIPHFQIGTSVTVASGPNAGKPFLEILISAQAI